MTGRGILWFALMGAGLGASYKAFHILQTQLAGQVAARRGALPRGAPRRLVLVLGAGFAGVAAAGDLAKAFEHDESVEIVLVDRHNYHLFTPLLYQVATGEIEPAYITAPVRELFTTPGSTFQNSLVQTLDLDAKRVVTDDGVLDYDYLVIALGTVTSYFGMENVQRNTWPLKEAPHAMALRHRVLDTFERADTEPNLEVRQELLTYVIVGAGGTGLELASSLYEYIQRTLAPSYPRINVKEEVNLLVLEGRDDVLPSWDRGLARIALRAIRSHGIEVRLNAKVVDVTPTAVMVEGGPSVPTRTAIWTAGIAAPPLVADLPGEKGKDGRLAVNQFLQLADHPEVFVVGDAARATGARDGQPVPPNASAAIQSGHLAAKNVVRSLHGERLQPFTYAKKRDILALGRYKAAAEVGPFKFAGLPAWLMFRSFSLYQLMGTRNRLRTALAWVFAFFYRREAARLDC